MSSSDRSIVEMALGEGQALRFFSEEDIPILPIGFAFEYLLAEFFGEKPI